MSVVKAVGDFFRGGMEGKLHPVDKYNIVTSAMSTAENLQIAIRYIAAIQKQPELLGLFTGKEGRAISLHHKQAVEAYKNYTRGLTNAGREAERKGVFQSLVIGLDLIAKNLGSIEDNYNVLFGAMDEEKTEAVLRSSSLLALGYMDLADTTVAWISHLFSHLTADNDKALIPPFWTNDMLGKAGLVGEFVGNNFDRWNPGHNGFLYQIRELQRKGADVAVNSGMGWIDDFVHDNQFTPTEQHLLTSALRNPILMGSTGYMARYQRKLELYQTRKEWLTAKVALEEAKLRGMDQASPEYIKLKKVVDNYANLVTKYEQKIERMRA